MAKKPKTGRRRPEEAAPAESPPIAPDHYAAFHCIGGECEDICCRDWRIDIDQRTFQRYQACQSETLAPLLREVIQPETDPRRKSSQHFAILKLKPDGFCPFLQEDRLCSIHKEMGAEGLSDTCAAYPRIVNRVGPQTEYGLLLSCPEAARVVLLHDTPTRLATCAPDPALAGRPFIISHIQIKPRDLRGFNQLRALILRILQWREVSLGARMMLVGALLDESSRTYQRLRSNDMAKLMPVMESYAALFADPGYVEAEFAQLQGNLPRKLQCVTGFLADFLTRVSPRFKQCIDAFADGLLGGPAGSPLDAAGLMTRYERFYDECYAPYFMDKPYVFENYLVNEAFNKVFPFGPGGALTQYRAMVFNLAIIQVMLVGMAGHFGGLTDALVIQFVQSFARRSAHNDKYLDKLTEALVSKESPSCVEVMWMLKER